MNYFQSPDIITEDCDAVTTTYQFAHGVAAGLTTRIEYYNFTGYPVTVVDRQGVCVTIHSSLPPKGLNTSFYVVPVYGLSGSAVNFNRPDVSNRDSQRRELAKAFAEAYDRNRTGYNQYTEASVVYEIPYDAIGQGASYYRNLDLVISGRVAEATPGHPYELGSAMRTELESRADINARDTFSIAIKLVDINGRVGPKYININGQIFRVPASRDRKLKDGVYVELSERVDGDVGEPPPPSIQHYTLQEYSDACKADITLLRLHDTIDSARSLGDMQSQRKMELEEIQHQRKLDEQAWQREKAQHTREMEQLKQEGADKDRLYTEQQERDKRQREERETRARDNEAELKAQVARLQHDIQMEKLNTDRERNRREDRNSNVKDTVDIVKNVAALVGALATVITLYERLRPKP